MDHSNRVADLAAAFDRDALLRALDEAYRRGLADGQKAVRDSLRQFVEGPLDLSEPPAAPPPQALPESGPGGGDGASRAPRGLTRTAITTLLKVRGAMKMGELQEKAVHWDDRISPKTVYNELKRERGRLYRELNDMWSLLGDSPIEAANQSQQLLEVDDEYPVG